MRCAAPEGKRVGTAKGPTPFAIDIEGENVGEDWLVESGRVFVRIVSCRPRGMDGSESQTAKTVPNERFYLLATKPDPSVPPSSPLNSSVADPDDLG
jgi:hypothetical protein